MTSVGKLMLNLVEDPKLGLLFRLITINGERPHFECGNGEYLEMNISLDTAAKLCEYFDKELENLSSQRTRDGGVHVSSGNH